MSVADAESIANHEQLARFVMVRKWVRDDGTIRSDAFIPPPDLNLSVTRHVGLSDGEIWSRGRQVAIQRERPLYGRADVSAGRIREASLNVVVHPLDDNPEHAHIVDWPTEKSARKMKAQELAASAIHVPVADMP